jgi:hypothetical protein
VPEIASPIVDALSIWTTTRKENNAPTKALVNNNTVHKLEAIQVNDPGLGGFEEREGKKKPPSHHEHFNIIFGRFGIVHNEPRKTFKKSEILKVNYKAKFRFVSG